MIIMLVQGFELLCKECSIRAADCQVYNALHWPTCQQGL